MWTPPGPGPATLVAQALHLAMTGGTIHLGQLLAAQGVQYIVVVDGVAPLESGLAASMDAPPPSGLEQALLNQGDLQILPGTFGVQVFRNPGSIPSTAQRHITLTAAAQWPGPQDIGGWQPVLSTHADDPGAGGVIASGLLYSGYAPADAFALTESGRDVPRRSAFGWAAQYPGAVVGPARFRLTRFPLVPLAVLVELLGWAVLAAALLGWSLPRRRSRRPEEP